MTVGEFISKLQGMPQDERILIRVCGTVDNDRMEDPEISIGRVEMQFGSLWEVRGAHGGRGERAVILGLALATRRDWFAETAAAA